MKYSTSKQTNSSCVLVSLIWKIYCRQGVSLRLNVNILKYEVLSYLLSYFSPLRFSI